MADASIVKVSIHIKRASNHEEWRSAKEQCQGSNNTWHQCLRTVSDMHGKVGVIDQRLISDCKYTNQMK